MYDAIIVGARCAGAPLAMLLARKGRRVLLADRTSFPSDTNSTHQLQTQGVARLQRWGLLDELRASGCPPIYELMMDFGPFALRAEPPPIDGITASYAPRRRVLDTILVRAAARAGAEVREGFSVDDLVLDSGRVVGIRGHANGGRNNVTERARIVVGADGMRSLVARKVNAPEYDQRPTMSCAYYSYFSNLSCDALEIHPRDGSAAIVAPTNDGLTMVCVQRTATEFEVLRKDPAEAFWSTLRRTPALHDRVAAARQEERFSGMGHSPNFFRKPWGDGWALVGDAGYHRDPTLGQGMSDAFRDAELLADAIEGGLSGSRELPAAFAEYHRRRDEQVKPMYDLVCQMATLALPPEAMALNEALRHDPVQRSRFFGVLTGAVPVQAFFSPQNIERILGGAKATGDGTAETGPALQPRPIALSQALTPA